MSNMMTYRTRRNNLFPETRFFDEFMRPFFGSMANPAAERMNVDVRDTGDSYLLEAEIPGANRDNLHVDMSDGVLTISAEWNNEKKDEGEDNGYIISERRYGSLSRSFTVENIREEDISAEYTDGVLKLTLPKKTPENKIARHIEIQ